MKLVFLGTGSAFTVGDGNYHSNMVLEAGSQKRLLIDCGSDIRFSAYDLGLTAQDFSDVYISHLHADHIGGLEWLAFSSKYAFQKSLRVRLHLHHQLAGDLWHRALSASLNPSNDPSITLSTYFDVHLVDQTFEWEHLSFQLVPTIHIQREGWTMPSFGLLFAVKESTFLITTDTQFCQEELQPFYQKADVIFQDCETAAHQSQVHAHYSQLTRLEAATKSKMWLYHYQPGVLPDARKEGFRGFVKKGQSFDLDALSKGPFF